MRLSRRAVMRAGAAGSLLAAGRLGAAGRAPVLVVFDRRLPASRAHAAQAGGSTLDLADAHRTRWAALRQPLPAGRIIGLTRWSDFVLVRGFAAEQGRRVCAEWRTGDLIAWELA